MVLDSLSNFSKRLLELRNQHCYTQQELAELADIDYKHYQSIESGRKNDVKLSTISKLAHAYDIEVWELLKRP